jgi:hypothetical protein
VADPQVCNSCPLKSRCTNGKSGRAVNRNFDEEYFEKVKSYYKLEAYKKAMRKRKRCGSNLFLVRPSSGTTCRELGSGCSKE